MKMKKIALIIILSLAFLPLLAEQKKSPAKDTTYWQKKGLITQIGFSQLSLMNWSAGGYGSISLNTYIDAYGNYKRKRVAWDNEIQLGYGFIQTFDGSKIKKSDDRIILDSKFGWQQTKTLYWSAILNFRSQFADGKNAKDVRTSSFMAPAYLSLGIGIDYKPSSSFALNFAPLTGKAVIVTIPELRETYGNKPDQQTRYELGAQLKADAKVQVSNFKVGTTLILFSDYLNKPQNIKVTWDLNVDATINKFFSVSMRTNLIYDDTIKNVVKEDGTKVPGIQFKELFSVGFSYTFGDKKK